MIRPHLPLNSLRAFEAAARHLSFTNASSELRVTPAALSHQVKALEERLGYALFHRHARGLTLTDEGAAMLPILTDCFDRIALLIERSGAGKPRDIVTVGAVGTFAVAWLLPRLSRFGETHPSVDLRLLTHNNRVELPEEGLDFAIRFGDGAWHGAQAELLFEPRFAPLCSPVLGQRLSRPEDLLGETLLRSYRVPDWAVWFEAAGIEASPAKGPMFDSARLMVDAAIAGHGIALAPHVLFEDDIASGRLCRPYAVDVPLGGYWLTHLKSKSLSPGMEAFRRWVAAEAAEFAAARR